MIAPCAACSFVAALGFLGRVGLGHHVQNLLLVVLSIVKLRVNGLLFGSRSNLSNRTCNRFYCLKPFEKKKNFVNKVFGVCYLPVSTTASKKQTKSKNKIQIVAQ